ncbi:MAG: ATP-binding protein [Anaerolineae bacterium]
MGKAQHFQLTILSDFSNLGAVADFITHAAGESGLDESASYNAQMAVDEAVTNVIEHAYHGRQDGQIFISCESDDDEFIIVIQDYGKPFDFNKVPKPRVKGPLARRSIGGLGVFFMKKLMDKVEFSSSADRGNRVRMVKRIR